MTLARDVPAFCSYFATYETLRTMVRQEDGRVGVLDTALIGGVSGVVGRSVEIPFDKEPTSGLNSQFLLQMFLVIKQHI